MAQELSFLNDDNLEVNNDIEVKYKNEIISPCNLMLIIFGSLCILIGLLDMIIFYVVPNNEVKKNKEKYPDYEFEKPDMFIVVTHFLEHIFLILTGVMIILAIIPDFHKTLTYILLIIFITLLMATFFFLNVIMSALFLKIIKKEDFTIEKIAELLNSKNPINNSLIYTTGKVKRRKGGYEDCNSDGAAEFPLVSELVSPIFSTKEYAPDFFYLIVTQKVNMSDELFDYFEKGKEKVASCEKDEFTAAVRYLPVVEGKNLITNGKKIPSKLKKKSAIVSIVFGQGVYYELLQKSIPIKRYTQYSIGKVAPNVNYAEVISNINCSQIGYCRMANPIPK